jgi:hypothetical protein
MKDTKPGDLVGTDTGTGRVRIDRVLPLPYVLGFFGALVSRLIRQPELHSTHYVEPRQVNPGV